MDNKQTMLVMMQMMIMMKMIVMIVVYACFPSKGAFAFQQQVGCQADEHRQQRADRRGKAMGSRLSGNSLDMK